MDLGTFFALQIARIKGIPSSGGSDLRWIGASLTRAGALNPVADDENLWNGLVDRSMDPTAPQYETRRALKARRQRDYRARLRLIRDYGGLVQCERYCA